MECAKRQTPLIKSQCFVISVTMSALIDALAIVKAVFVKYAAVQGDKDSLTKTEVSKLLREQIGVKVRRRKSSTLAK